jgi:hypothetical protein
MTGWWEKMVCSVIPSLSMPNATWRPRLDMKPVAKSSFMLASISGYLDFTMTIERYDEQQKDRNSSEYVVPSPTISPRFKQCLILTPLGNHFPWTSYDNYKRIMLFRWLNATFSFQDETVVHSFGNNWGRQNSEWHFFQSVVSKDMRDNHIIT